MASWHEQTEQDVMDLLRHEEEVVEYFGEDYDEGRHDPDCEWEGPDDE